MSNEGPGIQDPEFGNQDSNYKFSPLRHLMRAVWLQALRRNEIHVLGLLLGLYAAGALVLRTVGIGTAQTARFITDLGLQLGSLLAALLVIFMGARQLSLEFELRTIYPVLAKPVTRGQVLWGKALPTWLAGVAAQGLFTLATLALTPRLPYQHAGMLGQAFLLQAGALAMLTALVTLLALCLPPAVAILAAALVYFLGAPVANMAAGLGGPGSAAHFAAGLLPDFSLLHPFSRYVNGGALLTAAALAGFLVYAVLWTGIFGVLAARRFRRMAL